MKYGKRLLVFCFALLFSALSSVPVTGMEKKQDALKLISSMQIDLALLSTSIESYKVKISDLQNLMDLSLLDLTKSQDDLKAQKKLLEDSLGKLKTMETQYAELQNLYDTLNGSYQRSRKIIKYGGIGAIAVIIIQGIIIYLK